MQIKTYAKPIDLKILKDKTDKIFQNRKIVIPSIIAISGIFFGSFNAKGEGLLYKKITDIFINVLFSNEIKISQEFFNSLIIPMIIFFLEFVLGMSIIGTLIINVLPFCYGYLIGQITYFLYSTYSLKGLAYSVLILFPYAVITMLAIIMNCMTSIKLSQSLLGSVLKSGKNCFFEFKEYSICLLKYFIILLIGVVIKTVLSYFLSGFFNF